METAGEPLECSYKAMDVVMDRMDSGSFPNSLKEVLSQPGQFQWWDERWDIAKSRNAEDRRLAAEKAIKYPWKIGLGVQGPALFFYNPEISTSDPYRKRKVRIKCGNHAFK